MKLIIAMVQDQDAVKLVTILTEKGYAATKLASTGGFLRQGNTTLLIGVEPKQVEQVTKLIDDACHSRQQLVAPIASVGQSMNSYVPDPVEVVVGGATIFVVDVEKFMKV